MSRYTIIHGEEDFAYGFDHAIGPFFQHFSAEEELLEDYSYLWDGFDCHALAKKLQTLAVSGIVSDEQYPVVKDHIARLWMDLPI